MAYSTIPRKVQYRTREDVAGGPKPKLPRRLKFRLPPSRIGDAGEKSHLEPTGGIPCSLVQEVKLVMRFRKEDRPIKCSTLLEDVIIETITVKSERTIAYQRLLADPLSSYAQAALSACYSPIRLRHWPSNDKHITQHLSELVNEPNADFNSLNSSDSRTGDIVVLVHAIDLEDRSCVKHALVKVHHICVTFNAKPQPKEEARVSLGTDRNGNGDHGQYRAPKNWQGGNDQTKRKHQGRAMLQHTISKNSAAARTAGPMERNQQNANAESSTPPSKVVERKQRNRNSRPLGPFSNLVPVPKRPGLPRLMFTANPHVRLVFDPYDLGVFDSMRPAQMYPYVSFSTVNTLSICSGHLTLAT
ncbi:hypothetical protein EDD85DRAFT_982028 [Armillaria nabsnona]|nr:hypothetical protein EDD85DRAFT_982028 [Armillaria nabsnona]